MHAEWLNLYKTFFMKIFTAADIRRIDAATTELEPVSSSDLMERAAGAAFRKICEKVSHEQKIFIFAGPGNNGGDGLVIARLLKAENYNVNVFVVETGSHHSTDMEFNLRRLEQSGPHPVTVTSSGDLPIMTDKDIIIDAILGSGLVRAPAGMAAEVISFINASGAYVISIDTPSGLFCDDNTFNDRHAVVRASCTLTFQFPKLAFMLPGNDEFIGEWEIIDIGLHGPTISEMPSLFHYAESSEISAMLRVRHKFDHKGSFGHALLIAGSYGKTGAAILSSLAALRTGAGLVTLHAPGCSVTPVHASVPEVMVSPDQAAEIVTAVPEPERFAAVGIGPGLGTDPDTRNAFRSLLRIYRKPMVIDADALNILALEKDMISLIPENSVLTPHPGEFRRITGSDVTDFSMIEAQRRLASVTSSVIVLKGGHSSVAMPDGRVWFNSTGNPGMATAGSGDVLTGMITALLTQGYKPEEAAVTGVYIHGLAGDIALRSESYESLVASDIIKNIGTAFRMLSPNRV